MEARTVGAIVWIMESTKSRAIRTCEVCGLAVGIYEPTVFILDEEIVHSSRAAKPGLSTRPGCRLEHEACFSEHHH